MVEFAAVVVVVLAGTVVVVVCGAIVVVTMGINVVVVGVPPPPPPPPPPEAVVVVAAAFMVNAPVQVIVSRLVVAITSHAPKGALAAMVIFATVWVGEFTVGELLTVI